MYRNLLVPMLIAGAVLLAACGNPTATPPTPTEMPLPVEPSGGAASGPEQPTATASPAQSGPADAAAPAANTRVVVLLADNTLETSQTSFKAGVTYTFEITNNGRREHNFNINPPVAAVGSVSAALDAALLVVPKDQLGPGETAVVEFTFPPQAVGMELQLSCLIRRHYDDGMFQAITVSS